MKKKTILFGMATWLLTIATGCSQLEYVGRNFDELPEEAPILFTWERSEIDPAQYMIVGHAILTVSGRNDRYGIEDELTEAARKHGADAVCVVNTRRVEAGLYDLDEDELFFAQGVKSDSALMKPVDMPPEEDKKWGTHAKLQGEYHGRKLIKVRAVFWKNRKEAEPLLRQQEELLERKAAGNWNGENVPDLPKVRPEKENLPETTYDSNAATIPVTTVEPDLPPPQPETKEPQKSSDPEIAPKTEPLMQGATPPHQPQMAVPPNSIFVMP
ncbi:MAG: hypothetical protein MJ033_08255 [Victivallaceae bacterium]|nr:hypothetical protein [Victivallaceae bacterium]